MNRAVLCLSVAGTMYASSFQHSFAQGAPAPTGLAPSSSTSTAPAVPVTTGTVTPAQTAQEMAPIIVTGSAIPTTDTEGSTPVVVIDSDTIQKRAYQNVEDIVRDLPANGSFSNPGQTSGNFAAGAAYVSLRGLGPQATLVLINGRRVSDYAEPANGQYAFVDLNNIPAQIVDRVEVLTSGTALYGADAVAGVVNIITKTNLDAENGEVDAYFGNTDNHDAFIQRYTAMGNLDNFDKSGYGVVEIDYEHQNSILAPDRQISQSANQTPNGGFDLRSGRTFPGQFSVEEPGGIPATPPPVFSILPGAGPGTVLSGTAPGDPFIDENPATGQPAVLQNYDYNPPTTLIPETERYGLYLNYTYKFYDGNITPNLDFDYRHNRTIFQQAPAGWTLGDGIAPQTSPTTGEPTFRVPQNNPYNNTNGVIDILSYRFTDLGPRYEDVDNDVFRAVPSVDFKLGEGWTLNAGFNYNYSFVDDRNIGYPSAAAFQAELDSSNPKTAYDPFTSAAAQPQSVLNNLLVTTGNRDTTSLIGEDFRLNGSPFDLPAGPVQVAFGGEYRLERYDQTYSPADLSGDVISSTVQLDTAASRKALSGYTEVNFPLTAPGFNCPGFYSFNVDVIGRVDKYSTFGSTENPQISMRWETIPGLVIRGSYSKAFRAPSLPELFAGGNQAVSEVYDPVANELRDVTINGGGNPKLQPETAEIFTGGVAYTPSFVKGLLVSLDYFKIRYRNQITQEDPQTLIDEHSSQVTYNPDGTIATVTATYDNVAFSSLQGIDAHINYVIGDPMGQLGQLDFDLNSTLYVTYKTDNGSGLTENVGQDSYGLGPFSRYRQDVTATWNYRNFSYTLSSDFLSGYADSTAFPSYSGTQPDNTSIERSVANYLIFNMQASYTFDKQEMNKWLPGPRSGGFDWRGLLAGTTLSVGVNNVWDVQPPFTADPYDTLGYDPDYADPTGRFVYGEITKKF